MSSASPCEAQAERYELGKRLRRVEVAWQEAAAAQRAACAVPMQSAVQSFFGLQLTKAGRWLDEAYFTVRQSPVPTAFERLATAQRLEVSPACVPLDSANVNLRLSSFYALESTNTTDTEQLRAASIQLALIDQAGNQCSVKSLTGAELLAGYTWPLGVQSEGDYWIELTITATTSAANSADGTTNLTAESPAIVLPRVLVSVVSDPRGRLEQLDTWLKQQVQARERLSSSETIRLTIRQYLQIIRSQLDGRSLETDYPALRLLATAESLIQAPAAAATTLQAAAAESLWLTLSYQRQSLPVRVHMPGIQPRAPSTSGDSDPSSSQPTGHRGDQPTGRPVLLAFHGAGGSENMFFETYGAGRLVELASERGWLVVAPRHPLLGMPLDYRQMLAALGEFFPIDSQRVFLVGHSMGGGEVVRQVALAEQPPQAAVVIGGGGSAKDVAPIKHTPWLIAAGELDFGRSGARSLARRLTELGCQAEYREYAAVEHMVIVQAALDDLFRFLDRY